MRLPKAFRRRTLVARAGTIVLVFMGFSFLWIPITDQILGALIQDPVQLTRLATYKGSLYIVIVALFLFWLVVSALETTREERDEAASRGGHELRVELRSLWPPLALFASAALVLVSLGVLIYKAERGQAELGERLPGALQRLALIYGGVALLFLAVASIALFIWRRREETLVLAERQRIQAQNQLLEYRLEFLNQHANDIVLLVEPTGHIRYANDRAVEAYGYTAQQFQDLNLAELRTPETLQALPAQLATGLEAGALRFETVHRRKDGTLFPVEVSSRSLVLEDAPCVQSIIRDISERKQAEDALRRSSERYYRLFDGAVEGIVLADLELGVVLDCNQAFLKLVGLERGAAMGAALARFHRPAQLLEIKQHLQVILEGSLSPGALTTWLLLDSGAEKEVELKLSRIELDGKWLALGFFRDLTEERRQEAERETTLHLLRLLHERSTIRELIGNLTRCLQEWSGCEAVGIRLKEGEDFPYFETRGFPAEFVELERHLCARDPEGRAILDETGNPVLECMCGNVLCRRFNPALPFFTANGSFWSNGTTGLLASTTKEDRQARTRNRCNGEGYESVALIPLRNGDEVFGLLQLNDHAKDRFTPERIAFLEGVGDQIALALSKHQVLTALEQGERRFRDLSEAAGEFLWETDAKGHFTFLSERITEILGYTPEELLGHNPYEFIQAPEAEHLKALDREGRNFRNREVPLVAKSGKIVWASITRVVKLDGQGGLLGYFGAGLEITERKEAELVIRESERKLANLIGNLPGFVYRCANDKAWTMEFISEGCRAVTGYAPESFIDNRLLSFNDLIAPEHREAIWQAWQQSLTRGTFFEGEYPITTASGETRWVWERGNGIRDDAGRLLFLEGFITDITEQRQAASALKTSEEDYRRLFNTMKEGFALHEIITDAEGKAIDYRFLDINPAFEAMTGLPRERWLGRTVLELLPQTEAQWIETYGRVALTGEPVRLEAYAAALGRWYQVFAFSPGARQFAVLSSDITDRKQAELALQKSERFLKEAQRVGHVGCYSLDFATGELESSEILDEIFGIGAAYQRNVEGWLQLIVPESRAALRKHLEAIVLERSRFDYDYRIIRASDGKVRWVSGLGELELGSDGQPIRMFGTIQDITERKDAEAVIRRMTEELERRVKERTAQLEATNQELEAFSYSVSHDLRGPLRGIDGFSRALMEDFHDRLGDEGKHYLDRIRNGTKRMGQLIDDLLKLSRINRSELDRMDVDLSALCEKVLGDLARAYPERRVEVALQPGMTARADRRLLLGVLENLLGNAWKFTAKCEAARIEVGEATAPSGERAFCIRDNGAGFDMAYVDKLFNAFQRLHSADEFEGTGIGLAIVQRIIRRHGGQVWAEAEKGKGATLYFTLSSRGDSR